jgi:gliding motility-associated-like protein
MFKFYPFRNTILFFTFLASFYVFGQDRSIGIASKHNFSLESENILNRGIWKELIEERTQFSSSFISDDGTFKSLHSKIPINYFDGNSFVPIETELKQIEKDVYAALDQPYPTYLYGDGSFAVTTGGNNKIKIGERYFINGLEQNGEFLFENNIGRINSLTNSIFKEFFFKENSIKYNYVIPKRIKNVNSDYVFSESIDLPDGYNLRVKDDVIEIIDEKQTIAGTFQTPLCYDNANKYTVAKYSIDKRDNKHYIVISVPIEWINSSDRIFPVVIDPIVTGPISNWGIAAMPSCVFPDFNKDSLQVTIPAGITVTNFFVTSSFYADPNTGAFSGLGRMKFSTSCNNSPTVSSEPQFAITPGHTGIINWDLLNPLACCFPESCSANSFYLTMNLARTGLGTGCNGTYIRYDPFLTPWPFRAWVVGRTIESFGSQWEIIESSICSNECTLTGQAYVAYGVAPFTVSHPWVSSSLTSSVNGPCETGGTLFQLPLTIPNCPSYYDSLSTTLTIPPAVITDACGNSVTGMPSKKIAFNIAPVVTVNSSTICSGSTATLNANVSATGGTYSWSNGATTSSITVAPLVTTTYNVTYTKNGCSASASGTITVNPIPSNSINNISICSGSSGNLSANVNPLGGTYLWSNGATTNSINVSPLTTTNYTLVYTVNGCSRSSTGLVTVNSIPSVTVNSSTICSGSSVTLNANVSASGGTYLWSNGATTSSIAVTPLATSTYNVTYTLNGCISSGSGTITVNPIPSNAIGNITICSGSSVNLSANVNPLGGTYSWSNGANTNSINVSPLTTTNYTLVYTVNGCSRSSTGLVTVNSIPSVTVNSSTICSGSSVTLNANVSASGGTYLWSNGATTSSIAVTPLATSTYNVTYTLNGCISSGSGTITVNPIPSNAIGNITICSGSSVNLSANVNPLGGTYSWSNGANTSSINVSPLTTTNYSLIYSYNGCSKSASGLVTVNTTPSVTVNTSSTCSGSNGSIIATSSPIGTYVYSWTVPVGSNNPGNVSSFSSNVAGLYSVVIQNSNTGCFSDVVSGNLSINPTPTVSVNSAVICEGNSAILTATALPAGGSYLWSNGATSNSISVSPNSTTSYSMTYNLNGCESTSMGLVNVNPIPLVSVNSPSICTGSSTTMTATPNTAGTYSYAWIVPPGASNPGNATSFSTNVSGSYSVVLTDGLTGCVSSSAFGIVTVNPTPSLTVNSATICQGNTAPLIATVTPYYGGDFIWSNGETGSSINVNPTSTTNYSVTYNTFEGCSSNEAIAAITVIPVSPEPTGLLCYQTAEFNNSTCSWDIIGVQPTVTISPNTASININQSVTLTATGFPSGGNYYWDYSPTLSSISGAVVTATPSSTTTYNLVYSVNGCAAIASAIISINPLSVSVNSPSICLGESIALTATPSVNGGAYFWYPGGETTQSITVNPNVSTLYTVEYFLNGNFVTANSNVTVTPTPLLLVEDASICPGGEAAILYASTFAGGSQGSFLWSTGASTNSIQVSPLTSTSYIVVYTENGCTVSDTSIVTVKPTPILTVNSPSICAGQSVNLVANGSPSGGNYLWGNGSTSNSISVTPPGQGEFSQYVTYIVNDCPVSASSSVTVNAKPIVSVNSPTICAGSSATITASIDNIYGISFDYSWNVPVGFSNPGNVASFSSNIPGNYSVVVTDNLTGCESEISTCTLWVNPVPVASINNISACSGVISNISAVVSPFGGTYLWSTGETASSINVSPTSTTVYNLTYSLNGCSISAQSTLYVIQNPSVSVTDTAICFGSTANIMAIPNSVGQYNYNWTVPSGQNNPGNVASFTANTAGVYGVFVTDVLTNCASQNATGTLTINQSPSISLNPVTICDGESITLFTAVSQPGGIYSWSSGETTSEITVNPSISSSYSVSYALAGCTSPITPCLVTVSPAPTITLNSEVICEGENVTLLASVSEPGGSYVWSTGDTTVSITMSPISNSSYSVSYSLGGCTVAYASSDVTVNPAPNISLNSPTICEGENAVLIPIVSELGGTYSWTTGETTSSITVNPLISSSYSVSYFLGACSVAASTSTVSVNPAPTIFLSSDTICEGESIILNPSVSQIGGDYLWSTGETTSDITVNPFLTENYSVTYSLGGCTIATSSNIIAVSSAPFIYLNSEIICEGDIITLNPISSQIGGTYLWSTGEITDSIIVMPSATTSYTVSYSLGFCSVAIASNTITINPINITESHIDILCFADSTGEIDLTVTGGNGVFSYAWNNGELTEDLVNLPAAIYSITVQDTIGCSESLTVVLNEPIAGLSASSIQTNVLCFGSLTGAIDVTTQGGELPYSYSWNSGQNSEDISSVLAGNYALIITDNNGCVYNLSDTISEPIAPLLITETHLDVLCNGGVTGSIDITISGGTAPYSYQWNSGQITEDLSMLSAGSYILNLTDANGCLATQTITITEPSNPVSISANQTDILCFGDATGEIDLTITGGTMPYSFSWNNGLTIEDPIALTNGTYSVVVSDANGSAGGCVDSIIVVLLQPTFPVTLSFVEANVLCYNDLTGEIDLSANGGTAPYTFSWSNGSTTEDLLALGAGTYNVTVNDSNGDIGGCAASTSIVISEPNAPLMMTETHLDVLCNGGATGEATVFASGGFGAYNYYWFNGAVGSTILNLPFGSFMAYVSDDNQCTDSLLINIEEPLPLTINLDITDVLCHGTSTGSIDLTVNGGTLPYSFLWNSNLANEDLTFIPIGSYYVEILDSNGCQLDSTVVISEPDTISISSVIIENISCNGFSDGTIDMDIIGGVSPYNYAWSNGVTTALNDNIPAGNYLVSVLDVNNCISDFSFELIQPDELSATYNFIEPICFGGVNGQIEVITIGGTEPYVYSWSNGLTGNLIQQLGSGNYQVTITDSNGCIVDLNCSLGQPNQIQVTFDANLLEGCDPLNVLFTNTSNETFLSEWSFGDGQFAFGSQIEHVFNGTNCYDVMLVVTNTIGCSDTAIYNSFICSYSTPTAVINADPIDLSVAQPITYISNGSSGASSYVWNIGDEIVNSTYFEPGMHEFPPYVSSDFLISLVSVSDYGCSDTAYLNISFDNDLIIYVPNTFTPNNDDVNDMFKPILEENIQKYILRIFNRWGEIIFESFDPNYGWDGRYQDTVVPDGVYIWEITIVTFGANTYLKRGHVNLVR